MESDIGKLTKYVLSGESGRFDDVPVVSFPWFTLVFYDLEKNELRGGDLSEGLVRSESLHQ